MPSKYNGTLKTAKVGLGIVVSLLILFGMFFASKADIKETVDTTVTKEIADDNKLDDGKYYSKTEGTRLETKMEDIDDDMKEIKAEIKEMKKQTNENYKLLVKIVAKLDSGG